MEIKITEEMYDDAVVKTLSEFTELGMTEADKKDASKMVANAMLGLQCTLFASLLRNELFNIKEDK